ncbi:MAG: GNAT family N-acetyltransferase [Promethearchaeota archaeon]
MSTPNEIQHIEQAASRAWQAEHTKEYGGWLFRATEGVTRRANSVLPLAPPEERKLETALEKARNFYQQYRLPVRFQMTSASQPPELDTFLQKAGFIIDMQVKVLTAPLEDIFIHDPQVGIVVFGAPWKDWFTAYRDASGFTKKQMTVREEIIQRITTEKACAAAIMDDQVVGIGLAVIDQELLGLFSLITKEPYRKRGVASSITQSLISWGFVRGAKRGYLQVEQENIPAQKLYYGLGFTDAYSYWYRVEPD